MLIQLKAVDRVINGTSLHVCLSLRSRFIKKHYDDSFGTL